jgi:hypothetical protein
MKVDVVAMAFSGSDVKKSAGVEREAWRVMMKG